MDYLSDTWVLWLFMVVLSMVGMRLYRQQQKSITSVFSSSEDFSVRTILLGFKKGEGDLFIGYMVAMVSFSLFLAGIIRWVQIVV